MRLKLNAIMEVLKKIGHSSTFSAKKQKIFIYHDMPQRKASEKRTESPAAVLFERLPGFY